MGEVAVPADALYGASTQRAFDNFPISGVRFSRRFIWALGLLKGSAATVSGEAGHIEADVAEAVDPGPSVRNGQDIYRRFVDGLADPRHPMLQALLTG